jgi:hypothetical protein
MLLDKYFNMVDLKYLSSMRVQMFQGKGDL